MKTFKEQLKEEGKIFIHNFIMVTTILIGYDMVLNSPNIFGILLGLLSIGFGLWLFKTAMQKISDEFFLIYFPHLENQIKKGKN